MEQQVNERSNHGNGYSKGSHDPLITDAAGKYNSQYHHHDHKTGRQIRLLKYECCRSCEQDGSNHNSTDLIDLFLIFHEIPGKD